MIKDKNNNNANNNNNNANNNYDDIKEQYLLNVYIVIHLIK